MTGSPGHIELARSIDSIRIGSRHRTDLGDIDALAASIKAQGLLQPITVTPDGTLVCGSRRLAALRQLGERKINVWVRSGISDRLTQLLAEQDENALHKSLSPTEAATLYREVKVIMAEDAQRRQEASRFGSQQEKTRLDGPVTVTAPQTPSDGYARVQASVLVTGRRSYTTLERISLLQSLAADETLDDAVRRRAAAELEQIDDGGSVTSAHSRVQTQIVVSELERIAADVSTPEDTRLASSQGLARVRAAESEKPPKELERLARDAIARVKARAPTTDAPRSKAIAATLPARSFVFVWKDLSEWWLGYDAATIATELTEEQWEQFETTLAGTITFAERIRALRHTAHAPNQFTATISSIR